LQTSKNISPRQDLGGSVFFRRGAALSVACGLLFVFGCVPTKKPAKAAPPSPMMVAYQSTANMIIDSALKQNNAYQKLIELCDDVGHRLSGSAALTKAVDWAAAAMKQDGLANVRQDPVMVNKWVRGEESLVLLTPDERDLVMLGLGGSVSTPAEGITAEIVVVKDENELKELGEKVKGKIVLFNNVMPPYDPIKGSGYGDSVRFRSRGAVWAAEYGAAAALVRSVTATSLRSAHTGAMSYRDAKVKIPAAAISIEDADMLARLASRGKSITARLKMEARTDGESPSANVLGELVGTEKPEEIILLGAHIDSWDVGQGAHDDGAGCVMVMEALALLQRLNLKPKRTIRVVLYTNEENGLAGAREYAKMHASEKHIAAIESDSGSFAPFGLWVEFSEEDKDKARQDRVVGQLSQILQLTASLKATQVKTGHSGADISTLDGTGALLMGMGVDGSTYFDYHHSQADTLDKVDPTILSMNVAVLAVVAYVLADLPYVIGAEG
jgi:carboxypeptidase Q